MGGGYYLTTYSFRGYMARNYAKEYDNYQGTEEQKKRRAMRNNARRKAIRDGRASKGDGKDVHHPTYNPNSKRTTVADRSKNRSDNRHKPGEKQKR